MSEGEDISQPNSIPLENPLLLYHEKRKNKYEKWAGNNEKFYGVKRTMNYYFRKPPTTNPRIAHDVCNIAMARTKGQMSCNSLQWVQCSGTSTPIVNY